MRLAAREPEHLAELARVAEVHLGPAVLELETQMRVRVGAEAQLLPRARAPRARWPRAAAGSRARGEQLPGHAQVQHEPRAVVERDEQVLAVPLDARPRCGPRARGAAARAR